jgi:hypothetical protein
MPRNWIRRTLQPRTPGLRRAQSVEDRLADYSEAVALAEAGEQMLAADIIRHSGTGRRRILVIGHGCAFSARLGEYALGVAERMGSDLLLLSIGQPRKDNGWRESFAQLAENAAAPWREAASRQGLNVTHEVRFGNVDETVNELVRSCGRIEFILSEPEEGEQVLGQTGLALFTVK